MDNIGRFIVRSSKDGSNFLFSYEKNGISSLDVSAKSCSELDKPLFRQSLIFSWEKIVRNDIRILEDEVRNRNEALKKLEENIARDKAKRASWLKDKQNLEDRILTLKRSLP